MNLSKKLTLLLLITCRAFACEHDPRAETCQLCPKNHKGAVPSAVQQPNNAVAQQDQADAVFGPKTCYETILEEIRELAKRMRKSHYDLYLENIPTMRSDKGTPRANALLEIEIHSCFLPIYSEVHLTLQEDRKTLTEKFDNPDVRTYLTDSEYTELNSLLSSVRFLLEQPNRLPLTNAREDLLLQSQSKINLRPYSSSNFKKLTELIFTHMSEFSKIVKGDENKELTADEQQRLLMVEDAFFNGTCSVNFKKFPELREFFEMLKPPAERPWGGHIQVIDTSDPQMLLMNKIFTMIAHYNLSTGDGPAAALHKTAYKNLFNTLKLAWDGKCQDEQRQAFIAEVLKEQNFSNNMKVLKEVYAPICFGSLGDTDFNNIPKEHRLEWYQINHLTAEVFKNFVDMHPIDERLGMFSLLLPKQKKQLKHFANAKSESLLIFQIDTTNAPDGVTLEPIILRQLSNQKIEQTYNEICDVLHISNIYLLTEDPAVKDKLQNKQNVKVFNTTFFEGLH